VSDINVTVVSPLFNESERFNYRHWSQILDNNTTTNFLLVDDGSNDNLDYISLLQRNYKNVFFLKLEKNFGKANAVRLGIMYATTHPALNAEILGYLDFDNSILESEIKRLIDLSSKLLNTFKGYDSLWASRVKLSGREISRSNMRHFYSRLIVTIIGLNYPYLPYDSQCGFKLFLNDTRLKNSLQAPFVTRWFLDLELLIRMTILGRKKLEIWEEPLSAWRETKSFNYHLSNSFCILWELIYVCKEIRKIRNF